MENPMEDVVEGKEVGKKEWAAPELDEIDVKGITAFGGSTGSDGPSFNS